MLTEYFEIKSEENILRGIRHISTKNSDIAYVIVHGYFSSNKIGPHRLYVEIADFLATNYGDAYRFDLSGMGESDGKISNVKLKNHVSDLRNMIEFLKKRGYEKIIPVSHCMGCNLTLEILKEHKEKFPEIIFLAPYFTNEEILKLFFKNDSQLADLYVKGYTYRNGLYTDRSFFLENSFYDNFIKSINECGYCINIIAAGSDQFIPFSSNELLRMNGNDIKFYYIPNADHNFLNSRKELMEKLDSILSDDFHA